MVDLWSKSQLQLAVNLLRTSVGSSHGNYLCSPLSLLTSSASLLLNCSSQSAAELKTALHIPASLSDSQLLSEVAKIVQAIGQDLDENTQISLVNGIFLQEGLKTSPGFGETFQKCNGHIVNVDSKDSRKLCDRLNSFLSDQSHNKITGVVSADLLTGGSDIIAMSGIHFMASWYNRFNPYRVDPMPFHVSSKSSVEAQMLSMDSEFEVAIFKKEGCKMINMAFEFGTRFCLLLLLPDSPEGLENLEKNLTAEKLANMRSQLKKSFVLLQMPQFKLSGASRLDATLSQLGAKSLFDKDVKKVEIAGITSTTPVHAIHAVQMGIYPDGVESEEETGMFSEIACGFPNPVDFNINHPFAFVVVDDKTGAAIFVGRVVNPNESM